MKEANLGRQSHIMHVGIIIFQEFDAAEKLLAVEKRG